MVSKSSTRRLISTLALAAAVVPTMLGAANAAPIGDERAAPGHIDQGMIDQGKIDVPTLFATGRGWFLAKFTLADGAGRPTSTGAIIPTRSPNAVPQFFRTAGPDSNACRGCHNDPETGGAGEFVANVFVSEGFADADFDTVSPQFSNERGTPSLEGAGFVEMLAREMTRDLRAQRSAAARDARTAKKAVRAELRTKGVSFGTITVQPDGFADVSRLEGVDQDLIVRPFSQKGVFTSLRQFTVNALNAHHGMQASERFGAAWTGSDDFDQDGVANEVQAGDVTALVVFQALLPPPRQVLPQQPERLAAAQGGEKLFREIGCASCHVPTLPLEQAEFTEPNPYNPAGNLRTEDVSKTLALDLAGLAKNAGMGRDERGRILVPVFSDLKRHRIADDEHPHFANEMLAQRFVNRDEFLTPRLWGVGTTAPYGHRGDLTTLDEAIRQHGAEGNAARLAYEAQPDARRRQIVEFLLSLRIVEPQP
jgi:hypothetical protein